MKKYIKHIIIGFVIVLGLDLSVGRLLNHYYFKSTSGLFQRTTFSMEESKADILVFGTSRANHHYDIKLIEEKTGISAYNTGRDGNFVFYQTAILKSVLERYTPKKIILDFSGTFAYRQEDYDRLSTLLPYYKTHPEIRDIIELKSSFERFKLMSSIYPYNSLLTTIIVGNLDFNKTRKNNQGVFKGYVPLAGVYTQPLDSLEVLPYYEKIDNNKIAVFTEFLNLSKENNIDLTVVYSPVYYLYENNYDVSLCREICKENSVRFIDYSKDEEFLDNSNLFRDKSHLNSDGASLLTNKVLEEMKKTKG
jgi:hypothetical protein